MRRFVPAIIACGSVAVPIVLAVLWSHRGESERGIAAQDVRSSTSRPEAQSSRRILHAREPVSADEPLSPEEYAPPAVESPELASFVDREAGDRVPADITSRIPRVRHEEDIPTVVSVLLDTGDDDTVRNEAANLLRRSGYEGLTDDLINVLNNPEEKARFRSFAVQHLWHNAKNAGPAELERITATFRQALDDRHVQVRREALLALVRIRDPKGKETAIKWLTAEKAEGLRDAAIRCVRELGLREYLPTIRKYVRDPDTVVRIAAIVTLSQWNDVESRPAFEEAANSDNFRLQRAGKLALRRIRDAEAGQAQEPEEPPPTDRF